MPWACQPKAARGAVPKGGVWTTAKVMAWDDPRSSSLTSQETWASCLMFLNFSANSVDCSDAFWPASIRGRGEEQMGRL